MHVFLRITKWFATFFALLFASNPFFSLHIFDIALDSTFSFVLDVCVIFFLNFVIDWGINDFIYFRSQSVAINRIPIYCWTMAMVALQMANARVIIFTIKPYVMTLINLHIGQEVKSICDFHAILDLTFIWYMHSHIALVHSLMMKIGGILTIVHLFVLCYTFFYFCITASSQSLFNIKACL